MYSLARNHLLYFTQAIEDIDSNAKEEMKSEEQVMYTMVMSVCYLQYCNRPKLHKTIKLHKPLHALRAYNIQNTFFYHLQTMPAIRSNSCLLALLFALVGPSACSNCILWCCLLGMNKVPYHRLIICAKG